MSRKELGWAGHAGVLLSAVSLAGSALAAQSVSSGDPTRGVRLQVVEDGSPAAIVGLSADGCVVWAADVLPNSSNISVFRWTPEGVVTRIREYSDDFEMVIPRGVSRDGTWVTGSYVGPLTDHLLYGGSRAFRWSEATGFELLPDYEPEVLGATGIDITRDGVVLGRENSVRDRFPFPVDDPHQGGSTIYTERVQLWGDATGPFEVLGEYRVFEDPEEEFRSTAISDDGSAVIGFMLFNGGLSPEAHRWTAATAFQPLFDEGSSRAEAISVDGSVVAANQLGQAFRWTTESVAQPLDYVDSAGLSWLTLAQEMTSDGSTIVGSARLGSQSGTGRQIGVLWDIDDGMEARVLNEIVRGDYGFDLGGLSLADVRGVSDDTRVFVGGAHRVGSEQPGFSFHLRLPENPCFGDVTTEGALPGDGSFGAPDGEATIADLTFEVERWISGDPLSDATTIGAIPGEIGYGLPDGRVTVEDLTYFIEAWLSGCP